MNSHDILKKICKITFIFGGGDAWFEENKYDNILYRIYSYLMFMIMDIFVYLEVAVVFFGGYPEAEVVEAGTLGLTHFIMMIKRYSMRYYTEITKQINKDMIEVCSKYENEYIRKKQFKKIKINIMLYFMALYTTVFLFVIKATQNTLTTGEPFLVVITYWPKYEDTSMVATIVRIMNVFIFFAIVGIMVSLDALIISHLIMLAHKYNTLRYYFKNLRKQFEIRINNEDGEAVNKLRQGCVKGIQMHQKLLRLSRNIQNVFGFSMSMQLCLCSGSAVLKLMQFASDKQFNLTSITVTIFFIGDLLFMLAVILWNAGDLTYEASLLPNAIFNCGWHLSPVQHPSHKDIRKLVVLACTQSQRPLVMKVLGVQDLSYATFASVVRKTYSVFAVFYNATN